MKVLLRNVETGEYLQPSLIWVAEQRSALSFDDPAHALAYAVANRLKNVAVHLYFGPAGADVFLPVTMPVLPKTTS